jgi:hypothetical protein
MSDFRDRFASMSLQEYLVLMRPLFERLSQALEETHIANMMPHGGRVVQLFRGN